MKRIISGSCLLVLSASLVFPFTPALASSYSTSPVAKAIAVAPSDVKLSKEQAIAQAKKYVSIPEGYQLDNTSFRAGDTWRPFPEWSFNWVKKTPNSDYGFPSISVSVHADTGELTSYSTYNPTQAAPVKSTISRTNATKVAEDFISRVSPQKMESVKLYTKDLPTPKPPLGTTIVHYFRFARMVDNIPFLENSIDVSVDGNGQIISYQLNWNDKLTFEDNKRIIEQKEALETFRKNANVTLSYIMPWERMQQNDKFSPILAYTNPFSNLYLDATNGKPMSISLVELKKEKDPEPVTDKPLSPLHSGAQLDQDGAVKLAVKLFSLSKYELKGANYNENDYRGGRGVWDLQFENNDTSKERRFAYVALDASTGDVLSFSNDYYDPAAQKEKPKYTEEQGKAKAVEFIRKNTPTLAANLYMIDNQMNPDYKYQLNQGRLYFGFKRFVNDVPAATGDANVTFDMKTGEILHYYINVGKEVYPTALPEHKSKEDALEAYLNESEVDLVYVLPPIADPMAEKMGEIPNRTAKLVYRMTSTPFEQPYVFDAVSGEWKSQSSGKTVVLHRQVPDDLKNHPAATALNLMYEYDAISLVDGKIMPDKKITRGEMIDMLVITLNQGRFYPEWLSSRKASFADVASGSRYFASVETAVNLGILDKASGTLNPDEEITKEELADMLVRALGYKKLASYNNLFDSKLTDIANSKHRGSIAIVTALGIMSSEKNQFQPQTKVSRADAAVSFYNFLEKRRELVESRFPQ
ncbi:S-layer homology domain-containing protein [Brevibacillus sp. SYSU BS000544]|uniref:S-layer homology domain-containing protein n=1 Tax=Brevibacillus sp. SYSU BS000544 TaxID=3416443 RepID=UPI003CE4E5B9